MATHETQQRKKWPLHLVLSILHMHAFYRKIADRTYMYGFQRSSAGSMQLSGFRENPTNILTYIAC